MSFKGCPTQFKLEWLALHSECVYTLLHFLQCESCIYSRRICDIEGRAIDRVSCFVSPLMGDEVFSSKQALVQFSSVAQLCPTLCDPMNCSTPGLPVYHQLLEFTQAHVHRLGDAIQPPYPLSSPSPPALNPFQHQSLFQ